jgi:AraC-like DNA-binding protein
MPTPRGLIPAHSGAEATKFWHDYALGLDLARSYVTNHHFRRHSHDTFVIIASLRGNLRVSARRGSSRVAAGYVVVFHPDEPHAGRSSRDDGWGYRALYPQPALLHRIHEELCGHRSQHLNFETLLEDRDLTRKLVAAHFMMEHGEVMEREAALIWSLGTLVSRAARMSLTTVPIRVPRAAVMRTRDFIQEHYPHPLTIERLSKVADSSTFQFIRAFQRDTGVSVHMYVTQLRLSHACRRLAEGEDAASVAAAVGFADQSHLIRRFRQAYGVTPGAYVRDSRS